MDTNCTKCSYSETASLINISRLDGNSFYKCLNENSPYYNNIVSDKQTCRLYIDYDKYLNLKDRKESILNIKNRYK